MRSGFVGTVGRMPHGAPAVAGAGASDAATDDAQVLYASDWCWIAAAPRPGDRLSVARNAAGISLAILGHLVDPDASPAVPLGADDVREHLSRRGDHDEVDLSRYEGSYQVLVIDEPRRTVYLLNDHLASRPVFHGQAADRLAFGRSEDEVARSLGLAPRISFEGAAGFLAVGYPLGSLTLSEGVHRLRPGRELRARADGVVRERTWWDLRFGEPAQRRLEDAVEELHALARAALAHELADGSPFQLALTGGHDSRLLLGLLREAGRLPETTFTWYSRPDVAGSDPHIAAALASLAGVPHRSLRYEPASFGPHLESWLRTSALGSDNLGHVCAGEGFLTDHGLPARPVILGDHVLGLGGAFATDEEATAAVLRTPWPALSPTLHALLTPEAMRAVRSAVTDQIAAIAAASDARQPKDLHHYLYFHVGVFGWLLAPGYYKEPVTSARRPLANRALLEAASRWPAALRHDKRVVVALLQRRFADLHALPTADRSALVDWRAAVRDDGDVGTVLEGLLGGATRADGLLAERLRHDTVAERFSALRRSLPVGRDSRRLRAWAVQVRRSLARLGAAAGPLGRVERLVRRAAAGGGLEDDLRHLFRVGLLAGYEGILARDAEPVTRVDDGPEGRP